MLRYIQLVALVLICGNLFSQNYKPVGHHFATNYTSKQYKLNTQNFDIEQDNRGVMYFANDGGVLEFDGEVWRTIKVPSQRTYALVKSQSGNIYVGALGDFGVLETKKGGELSYKSLPKLFLKEEVPTIRDAESHKEWIYFYPDQNLKSNLIYAFDENRSKLFKINTPGKLLFFGKAGEDVVVQIEGKGLFRLDGNRFEPIGDATSWSKLKPIESFFYFNNTQLVYDKDKVYACDRKFSTPIEYPILRFAKESHDFLVYKRNLIYCDENGLNIVSSKGELLFFYNKKFNLVDNNIRETFLDNTSNLWLATENGISVLDVSNALTFFNYSDGIDGLVEFIGKYDNSIFAESKSGVFRLKKSMGVDEVISFEKFKSITNAPYGVTSFYDGKDSMLFVADFYGVLRYKGGDEFQKVIECAPWNIHQYNHANDVLLVPDSFEGLILLVKDGNQYTKISIPKVLGKSGRQVYQDANGVLWLSEETNGIYRIVPHRTGKKDFSFTVDFFSEADGLPNGFTFAFEFNQKTCFGTEGGFYEFDGKRFVKSKQLQLNFFAKNYTIHRANTDPKGNLWVSAYDVNDIKHYFFGYGTLKNDKIDWHYEQFFKVSEEKIDCIFHENENVSWLGGPDGLFRYDKSIADYQKLTYNILLRKFRLGNDSVLYGGSGKYNENDFVFDYAQQHYVFSFASTYYKTESGVKYSYYLEGFDKDWSKYTSNHEIEFANLYEGNYVLHVKAIDDFGNESNELKINFTVHPPWYRTTLAYIGIFILFVLIVWGAVRISSIGLKKIIAQRTREIEEQKHIVEEKNREIIDSISYAERLQQAILPDQKTITEYLPSNFILYKPKDIIAGDFYWLEVVGRKLMFAVCDCTGHGVPGAMVSVVGANALNRCVKEFGLREPAKILDKLTQLVEETFSHSGSEVKDGMDVSLCVLDLDTKELQWAGANNPLWLVLNKVKERASLTNVKFSTLQEIEEQHGVFTFAEIKADKQPIGKFDNRKPFTNHCIQLEKGDYLYMFSDGYADQFGGDKGKKFKYSQLREYILQYIGKPLDEQNRELTAIFESWRGEMEQTDDVCLWGVRI